MKYTVRFETGPTAYHYELYPVTAESPEEAIKKALRKAGKHRPESYKDMLRNNAYIHKCE